MAGNDRKSPEKALPAENRKKKEKKSRAKTGTSPRKTGKPVFARIFVLAPRLLLPAIAVLSVCILLFLFLTSRITGNPAVAYGVTVQGIDLGGQNAEALSVLLPQLVPEPDPQGHLTLATDEWQTETTFEALELRIDHEELLRQILSPGHEGSLLQRLQERMALKRAPLDISVPVRFNTEAADALLKKVHEALYRPATGARLELSPRTAILSSGTDGETVDTSLLAARMLRVLSSGQSGQVRIPTILLRSPSLVADALLQSIRIEPQNASIKEDETGTPVVIPSRPGRDMDMEALKAEIRWIETRTDRHSVSRTLPITVTEPEVTEADLRKESRLDGGNPAESSGDQTAGSFSTVVPQLTKTDAARGINIHLAAEAIDGRIIAPGEIFSFNETTGPRTVAAGYVEAPAYALGRVVMDVGGGICQVSTTLFNALLEAGLEPVERHPHMFTVSYAAPGRDATVSYGYKDLRFRNPYEIPIRLRIRQEHGILQADVMMPENIQNPRIFLYTRILSVTPALQTLGNRERTSERIWMDTATVPPEIGLNGVVAETWRQRYSGGNLIAEEKIFESQYAPFPSEGL